MRSMFFVFRALLISDQPGWQRTSIKQAPGLAELEVCRLRTMVVLGGFATS